MEENLILLVIAKFILKNFDNLEAIYDATNTYGCNTTI